MGSVKKEFSLFLVVLFLVLFISLCSCEVTVTPTVSGGLASSFDSNQTGENNDSVTSDDLPALPNFADNPNDAVKEAGEAAGDSVKGGLNQGNNNSEVNDPVLSSEVESMAIAFFQVKEGGVTLKKLVILIGIFILLLIIFYEVSKEIIDKKFLAFLFSFALTFIISLIGIIDKASKYYLSVFEFSTIKTTAVSVIIVLIVFFVVKVIIFFIKNLGDSSEEEEAARAGQRIGLWARMAGFLSDVVKS